MLLAQDTPAPITAEDLVDILPPEVFSPEVTVTPVASAVTEGSARFLDPWYYLNPSPFEHAYLWGRPLAVLFLVLLIVAMVLLIRTQLPRLKHRATYRAAAGWLLFFGVTGFALLYFRRDRIPFLGMRLWMALLLAGLVAWLVWTAWRVYRARR